MKECRSCGNTYTDDSLRYCLSDGSLLTDLGTEQVTVVKGGTPPIAETPTFAASKSERFDIPVAQPVAQNNANERGISTLLKILLIGVLLIFIVIAALGIGGFIFYRSSISQAPTNRANSATPMPSPTADKSVELREQIANLEKRLNEQKAANRAAPNTPANIPMPTSTKRARVDSPSDGFLALRSLPNSEAGARLLKIPHGATVTIGECSQVVTPVNRPGRWCQASYNGRSGWVFDAYLVY